MNEIDQLRQMRLVTRAGYDRVRESYAAIIAEENALRAELSRLDGMARAATAATDVPQRAIGADVIWQGWLGRKRTELNMRLAGVLARKDRARSAVRRAYGKVLVVEDLLKQAQMARKQRLSKQALSQIIERAARR